jgi:Epoxide hydrolase N terminus
MPGIFGGVTRRLDLAVGVDAVLFDMDGTLVDSDAAVERAWRTWAGEHGWSQGVPLGYLRELCGYWAQEYDWPARQHRLNALSQFRTEIGGLGIHFIHVRSPHPAALPLVMTHGWPGSMHATRPQTIGYALADSPVALCAWIIEKFWSWTDHDGDLESVISRDDLLDNLMLYWLPRTGASSARLYWESIRQVNEYISGAVTDTVSVPVGCSIFPKELQRPSRRWAQRRFADIRYWNEPERGGHFAAFEQPALFVNEVRECFRALR